MERDGKMGVHLDGSMGVGVSRLEVIEVAYGTVEEGSEAEATLQDEYDSL